MVHPERITIDIVGPFSTSHSGNKVILVVGDYFTKWTEAYALPNQEAETVAKILVEEFICRFGAPLEIHSDQGRNFEASVFQEVSKLLKIHKTRTTPFNPKSDGMIERFNRTLVEMISKIISSEEQQHDWDEQIPYVLMAYRTSVHESTGETPSMMMLGRELRLPIDFIIAEANSERDPDVDYAYFLRNAIYESETNARVNLKNSARRQKTIYDRRLCGRPFQKSDLVWVMNQRRKRGYSPKLQTKWEGPYEVIDVLSEVVYRIKKPNTGKSSVVHFDKLKPYLES